MANKIETLARNMRLTDNTREYVEKKAAKLERYLQEIDEIRVELSHVKTARSALDRQVAQITVRGKGFILRTEERADETHVAFDSGNRVNDDSLSHFISSVCRVRMFVSSHIAGIRVLRRTG